MNIVFTPTAWQHYLEWQKEDKKIVKRINELIKSIDREGILQGLREVKPKQSCIIGCQILLTPTSYNNTNIKSIKFY